MWFEPKIVRPILEAPPQWLNNYYLFTEELWKNFGPYDPEGEAETAIENLIMCNNHHITKYVIEFYRLAAEIKWDDASLHRRFYRNLPARLKNKIT